MSKGYFIVLMATIMAADPFAVDSYLPGIPSMAEYQGVGVDSIATTVSFYIFGMALGQLIGGPLADRFDKRVVIIVGMSVYALSSFIIANAESLHLIQIARIIQAIGGGFAGVCVAPAIASSIGALILLTGSWQNIFYFSSINAIRRLYAIQGRCAICWFRRVVIVL